MDLLRVFLLHSGLVGCGETADLVGFEVRHCGSVALQGGTERAFTGKTVNGVPYDHTGDGVYCGAASGLPLFLAKHKFESGSGWPSFTQPIDPDHVDYKQEGDGRIEVIDAKSGAHLGHVFRDGPKPAGLRFCINAAALHFVADNEPAPRFMAALNRYIFN